MRVGTGRASTGVAASPGSRLGAAPDDHVIRLAIQARSRASDADWSRALERLSLQPPAQRQVLGRAEFVERFGADSEALHRITAFAGEYGLEVLGVDSESALVTVSGPVVAIRRAFRVELDLYQHGQGVHHSVTGDAHLPEELAEAVVGVYGLDGVPRFDRPTRRNDLPAAGASGAAYTPMDPVEVGRAYDFPADLTGAGQRIAILLLGGGFCREDLETYFDRRDLAMPSIEIVELPGAKNDPVPGETVVSYLEQLGLLPASSGDPPPKIEDPDLVKNIWWTIEATLDVELAGTYAPGAELIVVFAPNNEQGKIEALATALSHSPTVISSSWGATEESLHETFIDGFDRMLWSAALKGISVCYSSGDHGSDESQDGEPRVQFPASSPHVLCCGGTTFDPPSRTPEIAWNEGPLATGGGFSRHFMRPGWQTVQEGEGRGIPDVAAKADMAMGYEMVIGGKPVPMGGTSAATPLWAGLLARLAEGLGVPVGWLTPLLYRDSVARSVRDVVEGNNGYYQAGPGWDPCTGQGSPNGRALLAALSGRLPTMNSPTEDSS